MQRFLHNFFPAAMFHLTSKTRSLLFQQNHFTSFCTVATTTPRGSVWSRALEIIKIFPLFLCRVDRVLLKFWAHAGLCCELSKIPLFTAVQAYFGISIIPECPSLAEVFALLLCLNHNHVQILLSKMVHQNRENFILRWSFCLCNCCGLFPRGRRI